MSERLHRYQTDPRFHALVSVLENLMEKNGDQFTVGEYRDAFTTALERREMLRVRPALGIQDGYGPIVPDVIPGGS